MDSDIRTAEVPVQGEQLTMERAPEPLGAKACFSWDRAFSRTCEVQAWSKWGT